MNGVHVCVCPDLMNRVSIHMLVEQSNCSVPATAGHPVDIAHRPILLTVHVYVLES